MLQDMNSQSPNDVKCCSSRVKISVSLLEKTTLQQSSMQSAAHKRLMFFHFKCIHLLLYSSLDNAGILILMQHCSMNFTRFHTFWQKKKIWWLLAAPSTVQTDKYTTILYTLPFQLGTPRHLMGSVNIFSKKELFLQWSLKYLRYF